MPQGRRKVPFSAKQKKAQLLEKREKKRDISADGSSCSSRDTSKTRFVGKRNREPTSTLVGAPSEENQQLSAATLLDRIQKVNFQSSSNPSHGPNRYCLQFYKETRDEIELRKQEAYKPLQFVGEADLEIDPDSVFIPGSELDMPKRPTWNYAMNKEQLDGKEQKYFREYLLSMEKIYPLSTLSYFELNLETWRQLWRVLEMSDIVLIIVDTRFPALLFSPALYTHITEDLKKDVILVFNKIDLCPPASVAAWKVYFETRFPLLRVICFTSFPETNPNKDNKVSQALQQKRKKGRLRMAAEGAFRLYDICEQIVQDKVDLLDWRSKIDKEMSDPVVEELDSVIVEEGVNVEKLETGFYEHERYKDGILSIGLVGHPNVGKSSLLNAIMGKKVVSVSRTPGHTKHFQTIFLTPTVKLCDCPGLVFPSRMPRSLQILTGCYPIAQVREPYTSVKYLAERVPVHRLLKLRHPEHEDKLTVSNYDAEVWSAMDVCDAWAEKRGFMTAKTGRNDAYRAANNLLRIALDGRLSFSLRPPGYSTSKSKWDTHPYVEEINQINSRKKELVPDDLVESDLESDQSEDASLDSEEEETAGAKSSSRNATKTGNKFTMLNDGSDGDEDD